MSPSLWMLGGIERGTRIDVHGTTKKAAFVSSLMLSRVELSYIDI